MSLTYRLSIGTPLALFAIIPRKHILRGKTMMRNATSVASCNSHNRPWKTHRNGEIRGIMFAPARASK